LKKQKQMIQWIRENLIWIQANQVHHVNNSRQSHSEYKIKNLMYVNVKDFSSKKLNWLLTFKNVRFWKIIRVINNKAYELKLSSHLQAVELTSIFYFWKLHFALSNSFFAQVEIFESLIMITDAQDKESHEKYQLLNIVDCRQIAKHDLHYKVTYIENWNQWMQIHCDNQSRTFSMSQIKSIVFIENISSSEMTQYERKIRFCLSDIIVSSLSSKSSKRRSFQNSYLISMSSTRLSRTRVTTLQRVQRRSLFIIVSTLQSRCRSSLYSKTRVNSSYLEPWKRVMKSAIEEQKDWRNVCHCIQILN
jgi:hypothetical protein